MTRDDMTYPTKPLVYRTHNKRVHVWEQAPGEWQVYSTLVSPGEGPPRTRHHVVRFAISAETLVALVHAVAWAGLSDFGGIERAAKCDRKALPEGRAFRLGGAK